MASRHTCAVSNHERKQAQSFETRRLSPRLEGLGLFSLMVRDGASVPARHQGCSAFVNPMRILTKSPTRLSFNPFRGHLSRPACSHVKQLAKQAGDRSDPDPGRTYVQAGFFMA